MAMIWKLLVQHRNPGPKFQVTEKGSAIKIQLFDLSKPMAIAPTFAMTTYGGVGLMLIHLFSSTVQ
jgi:hypothetical protein